MSDHARSRSSSALSCWSDFAEGSDEVLRHRVEDR